MTVITSPAEVRLTSRDTLKAIAEWLRKEAGDSTNQARARRDTADCMRKATAQSLKESRMLGEQMAGRKLPRMSVEAARKSADVDDRIAAKLENKARQLTEWADFLEGICGV